MLFVLPNLKYSYSALEPYIDALTMEIHHSKHHQAYINNLNAALEKHPELQFRSVEEVINGLEKLPEDIKQAVRNNAGGHFNHTFFWNLMDPNSKKLPEGELLEKINQTFGSVDQLREKFNATALSRFGSGWAWLVKTSTGDLEIYSTPNQDNPLMENKIPLIGLDVWEHAYYLKYQNRRADYISSWWNLLNWEIVEEKYNAQ